MKKGIGKNKKNWKKLNEETVIYWRKEVIKESRWRKELEQRKWGNSEIMEKKKWEKESQETDWFNYTVFVNTLFFFFKK